MAVFQIHNISCLKNLCLVDRAFNSVFSRKLYQCLRWHSGNVGFLLDPEKQRLLVHNKFLKYTKVIIVLASAQVEERRIKYGPEGLSSRSPDWAHLTYMIHTAAAGGSQPLGSEAVDPAEDTNGLSSADQVNEEEQQEKSNPLLSLSESLAEVVRHAPTLISFKYTTMLAKSFVHR